MTDKQIKEEIKHINTRSQEYIAKNNRMTDKQIIDDVDVSGCKDRYLGYRGSSCQNTGPSCPDIKCENNKDCYYRQLKSKEQECEELRIDIKDIANLLDLDTVEEYNFGNIELEIKELKQQLDQLKAEKEILEAHSATLDAVIETGRVQYKALKQTLTEIKHMLKEICMEECSFDWNKTSKKHCGDYDCRYGQIIQKISEVENGRKIL